MHLGQIRYAFEKTWTMTNLIKGGWLSHGEKVNREKRSSRDAFLVYLLFLLFNTDVETWKEKAESSTTELVHRDGQADR